MELPELFVPDAPAWRQWLEEHHDRSPGVTLVLAKKGTASPTTLTYDQALDEALCVGWIDGVRHRIDDERYQIRFTPRRRGSNWSNINIRRVAELKKAGRMKTAGLKAFAERDKSKAALGAYEQRTKAKLSPQDIKTFKRNAAAWKYYSNLTPGYLQLVNWWITTAKRPETRAKRLNTLIHACAEGRRLSWGSRILDR